MEAIIRFMPISVQFVFAKQANQPRGAAPQRAPIRINIFAMRANDADFLLVTRGVYRSVAYPSRIALSLISESR